MTKQESKLLSEINEIVRLGIRKPYTLTQILNLINDNCYNAEKLLQHLLLWIEKNNKDKKWKSQNIHQAMTVRNAKEKVHTFCSETSGTPIQTPPGSVSSA